MATQSLTAIGYQRVYRAHGFTLIEIMVVLVILTIVSSVAVLALNNQRSQTDPNPVCERLYGLLQLAQQQAVLAPAMLGVIVSDAGYQFMQFVPALTADEQDHWQPIAAGSVLTQVNYEHSYQQLLQVKQQTQALPATVKGAHPQIIFSSSGAVTPFSWQFTASDRADQHCQLIGNFSGEITFH